MQNLYKANKGHAKYPITNFVKVLQSGNKTSDKSLICKQGVQSLYKTLFCKQLQNSDKSLICMPCLQIKDLSEFGTSKFCLRDIIFRTPGHDRHKHLY